VSRTQTRIFEINEADITPLKLLASIVRAQGTPHSTNPDESVSCNRSSAVGSRWTSMASNHVGCVSRFPGFLLAVGQFENLSSTAFQCGDRDSPYLINRFNGFLINR